MDQNSKIKYTTIVNKYPSFRDDAVKGCWRWLEGRQEDDNAEGYWRIHDKLYNLNDFIKNHPGGSEWIALTKGIDITEAFESYHILPKASKLLPKFYVKEADKPRNYRLTYNENGFYRVLKSRVAEKLPFLDKSDLWKSKFCLDVILCGFFIGSIMTIRAEWIFSKIFFYLIASQCAGWINQVAHNFNHQRNNWRMYAANFVLMGWREWRVFHGLSHHSFPNSYADLEVSGLEPFLCWIPLRKRSKLAVITSIIISPLVYAFTFHFTWQSRIIGWFRSKNSKFHIDEILVFIPPAVMFLFGNPSFTLDNISNIIITWTAILLLGSFWYQLIGLNSGHHGYPVLHEGDEFDDLDFGIYQMAATFERYGGNYNIPISLTHFGDHTLHHLFPSLDHALLPQLRDVLEETCRDFNVQMGGKWTFPRAALEQFKQLGRTKIRTLDEPTTIFKETH